MKIRDDVISRAVDRQAMWENGGTWRHVAGNFDGQGMSLGSIQFAAGQGTLQPVLGAMLDRHEALVQSIFGEEYRTFYYYLMHDDFFHWAKRINDGNNNIIQPWHDLFEQLANTDEFKAVEIPFIQTYIDQAEKIINWFNSNSTGDSILTDRGFDLAFDIACQLWQPKYYGLAETNYTEKLEAITNASAKAASEQWKRDVYDRKIAIALPEGGIVHGSYYVGKYDDQPMYEEEYDMCNVQQSPFRDLPINRWSVDDFRWAKEIGLLNGNPDGTCDFDKPLTTERAVVMFRRLYQILKEE